MSQRCEAKKQRIQISFAAYDMDEFCNTFYSYLGQFLPAQRDKFESSRLFAQENLLTTVLPNFIY